MSDDANAANFIKKWKSKIPKAKHAKYVFLYARYDPKGINEKIILAQSMDRVKEVKNKNDQLLDKIEKLETKLTKIEEVNIKIRKIVEKNQSF